MPNNELEALMAAVKADPTLESKLKKAADSEAIMAIVREAGYEASLGEEIKQKLEPTDAELEQMAGGAGCLFYYTDDLIL